MAVFGSIRQHNFGLITSDYSDYSHQMVFVYYKETIPETQILTGVNA